MYEKARNMLLHKREIEDLIVFDINQQMLVFH